MDSVVSGGLLQVVCTCDVPCSLTGRSECGTFVRGIGRKYIVDLSFFMSVSRCVSCLLMQGLLRCVRVTPFPNNA